MAESFPVFATLFTTEPPIPPVLFDHVEHRVPGAAIRVHSPLCARNHRAELDFFSCPEACVFAQLHGAGRCAANGVRLYVFNGPKLTVKTVLPSVQMARNAARRVVGVQLVVAPVENEPTACDAISETADCRPEVNADSLRHGANPALRHPYCRFGPAPAGRPR